MEMKPCQGRWEDESVIYGWTGGGGKEAKKAVRCSLCIKPCLPTPRCFSVRPHVAWRVQEFCIIAYFYCSSQGSIIGSWLFCWNTALEFVQSLVCCRPLCYCVKIDAHVNVVWRVQLLQVIRVRYDTVVLLKFCTGIMKQLFCWNSALEFVQS